MKRDTVEVDHMSQITVDRLKYHMKEGGSDEVLEGDDGGCFAPKGVSNGETN